MWRRCPNPGDVLVHERDELLHVNGGLLLRQEDDGVGPPIRHKTNRCAASWPQGRKDRGQHFGDLNRRGRLERDVGDLIPGSLHVEGGHDILEPLDIGLDVGDDQHPRWGIGEDDASFGDQRVEDLLHLVRAGVLEGDDLGHEFVLGDSLITRQTESRFFPRASTEGITLITSPAWTAVKP